MPQEDPYAKYAVSPAPTTTTPAKDPYSQFAVTPKPEPTPPQPTSDPYAQFAVGGKPAEQPTEAPSDPNASFLSKAWDAANKPLSESLFGIPEYREGAGGFERGAEKILSGLTSPLSLGLTLATLGTGGFIESAGASALKQAGLSAAEIADVAKGAQAVSQATKTGQSIDAAVEAAGVNPDIWKAGQNILYNAGLKESDLIGGNIIERGASKVLRDVGLTPAKAQVAAKTMQGLVNAGFTTTQLQQAAELSPRVLDALKEGDYDHAAEYATEALAGGVLGAAGATHALHTAGELFEPVLGQKLRPSDETVKLQKLFNEREGAHEAANQTARLLDEESMKALGFKNPKTSPFMSKQTEAAQNATLAKIYHAITLGFDKDLAAQHYNAIAEAAGRSDRIGPENGQRGVADDWFDWERKASSLTGKPAEDVSLSDLEKSGASQEFLNQWDQYLNKPSPLKAEEPVLTEHARSIPIKPVDNLSPGLMVNDYAHELISRSPLVGNRDWRGIYLTKNDVAELATNLREKAGQSGSPVADTLEKALGDKQGVLVASHSAHNDETLSHEQIHHWQDQNPLSPEKIQEIKSNPAYDSAAHELQSRGYSNSQHFIDEVGAHLGTGDSLGLDPKEALSLAKSYFGAHGKESLTNFPATSKFVVQSFKELGYNEDINGRAIKAVLDQKARAARDPAQIGDLDPARLKELISNSELKNKPASYVDRLLDTYKGVYEGLNETEQKVADNLRNKLSEGFEKAHESGVMGNAVENYMSRVWKEPNSGANLAIAEAKNGRFRTNVSQARHRAFATELEPLLKGYEYATENPVGLTSKWLADVNKAIANRKLLDDLRSNFVRGSDGRPAVVMSGSGRVLEGSNGEDPVTMVSPNRVRDIRINDKVIDSLKNSGDLDRYLENGTITDVTPRIRMDNIGEAIDRLENKAVGKNPTFDEQGNVEIRQQIQRLKDIRDGKLPPSELESINAEQKPIYVWRPQDYQTIDNSAFRGWNFATSDPSGKPVLTEADIRVHPEYADYLKTRLGLDESALTKWAPIRAVMKASGTAKKTLLSLSPFHMMQEALRAVMVGINPIMKAAPTIENSPKLRRMVENHLTLESDYKAMQEHSEGVSGHFKAIEKVPILGKSLDWYEDFLFKRYIPNLKARAAELMYDKYEAAHPDWSKDKIAETAAHHVNDTFGGQNWRAMGRSAVTQDWARLMLLAPDWLESELRSGARLFNRDEGGIGRAQMARMTMGLWGVARVLNLLSTGNPHLEAPFGVAVKNDEGKETVFSMRTLPVDLLHAATDPAGFLKGRLSPAVRTAQEVYSGRDQFGRKLAPGDMWTDIFRNMSPLPLQSVGKIVNGTSPDATNTDQIVKALGGTAVTYKTEAQKLAAELASNHNEDGPVDRAQLHKHQTIIRLEDQVRSGKVSLSQLQPLRMSGQLSESDYKKIAQNYAKTRGMTADQASLYTRASRAPGGELLQIWDAATQGEKAILQPLLKQAATRYINKAMKTMTPQERMSDKTLARFMRFQAQEQQAPPSF